MINHLKGILCSKNPTCAVIEVNGIGFDIKIPVSTYERLPESGTICNLLTYLYFKQDEIKLYGFYTSAERELFLELISVSGVGPRIALSILSSLSVQTFIMAIFKSDENLISKVPGIGKKSAQRLIIELKDSIKKVSSYLEPHSVESTDARLLEVESALINLGYSTKDISKILSELPNDVLAQPLEVIIKESIKMIYQKRS